MVGFVMHVAKMTKRVRQREPVSVLAVKSYGLFVVVACGRVVVQLSLDLSEQPKRLRQLDARRLLA